MAENHSTSSESQATPDAVSDHRSDRLSGLTDDGAAPYDGDGHDRGDGHVHAAGAEESPQQVDPATQSLSDALRVSFLLLKIAMIGLVIYYVAISGMFQVEPQYKALRLRFGEIVKNDQGALVYDKGWHFAWPEPIESVIHVPTVTRTVNLANEFWYSLYGIAPGQTEQDLIGRMRPLNPMRDGSLLTGDANIIHGRFTVSYIVDDPVKFVRSIGLAKVGTEVGGQAVTPERALVQADNLVRHVAQHAIVYAVAQKQADQMLGGRADVGVAVRQAQQMLDEMETGLRIQGITAERPAVPLPVREAFNAVSNAESQRGQLIEAAQQRRARILGQAAGQAYEGLMQLIQNYELARDAGQSDTAAEYEAQLDQTLRNLQLPEQLGGHPVSGEVAQVIHEALTYRTQRVEQIKREAATFNSLLQDYRENPEIFRQRYWQMARQNIFTGDVETFYALPAHLRLDLNRDPEIEKDRERRRLEESRRQAEERIRQRRR